MPDRNSEEWHHIMGVIPMIRLAKDQAEHQVGRLAQALKRMEDRMSELEDRQQSDDDEAQKSFG